jgi:hypothetical protein
MDRNTTNHSLDNLTERFQSLTERKKAKLRVVEPMTSLPNWPSAIRGTPNACLRSALFAGIQGKERIAYKKRTLLAAVDGIEVRYLGIQLNQSDLDVWMQIVHLSRQQLPGFSVTFSAHALLTALGRGSGKSQHEWLKESMARLGGAFVEITFHGRDAFGEKGFLRYYRDERTQRYVVELTESMLRRIRAAAKIAQTTLGIMDTRFFVVPCGPVSDENCHHSPAERQRLENPARFQISAG